MTPVVTKRRKRPLGILRKLTHEQVAETVVLYESGLSLGRIAAKFGVSRQGLWDLLSRRLALRPQLRTGSDNHFHRGGVRADDKAHNLVEVAVRNGKLVTLTTCEACGGNGTPYKDGRRPIQAHHDDYNFPLVVRWLCKNCHHGWHRRNKAVPNRTVK